MNSAISFAAALRCASRAAARCASLLDSAVSIASSHSRELPVPISIHLGQRRVEARGHEQVLEVLVAAVREEVDDFFVCSDRLDLCVDQTSRRASESRPPRHRRDASPMALLPLDAVGTAAPAPRKDAGRDDLLAVERPGVVLVDHYEYLWGGRVKVE